MPFRMQAATIFDFATSQNDKKFTRYQMFAKTDN
jgi:hypothetical protein